MQMIEQKITEIEQILQKIGGSVITVTLIQFARLLREYAELVQQGSMTAARQAHQDLLKQRIDGHIKEGLLTQLFLQVKQAAPTLIPDLVKLLPRSLVKDLLNVLGPEAANKRFGFFQPAPTPTSQVRTELQTYLQALDREELQGQQSVRKTSFSKTTSGA